MRGKLTPSLLTGVGVSLALLASAAPASARWSVHDDTLATRMLAAPGGAEAQVCRARVRAETGYSSFDDHPADFVPPRGTGAYDPIEYRVYQAPPGFPSFTAALSRFDDTGNFLGFYFVDQSGVEHDAVEVGRVVSPARVLMPRERTEPGSTGFVYTKAAFLIDLPDSVSIGDTLGLAPFHGLDPTPLSLTAVSCAFRTPGRNATARAGKRVKRTVAAITGPGAPGDYKTTITWGDASARTKGKVTLSGAGLTVAGTHRFARRGRYTVQVRVQQKYTGVVHRSTGRITVRPRA